LSRRPDLTYGSFSFLPLMKRVPSCSRTVSPGRPIRRLTNVPPAPHLCAAAIWCAEHDHVRPLRVGDGFLDDKPVAYVLLTAESRPGAMQRRLPKFSVRLGNRKEEGREPTRTWQRLLGDPAPRKVGQSPSSVEMADSRYAPGYDHP
jgi:hypothetical protein